MELGSCRLLLNQFKSDCPLTDVTPAEVILLRSMHEANVGDNPIVGLEVTGEDKDRTPQQELMRLMIKYKKKNVEHVYPGAAPALPLTFREAGLLPSMAIREKEVPTAPEALPKPSPPSQQIRRLEDGKMATVEPNKGQSGPGPVVPLSSAPKT